MDNGARISLRCALLAALSLAVSACGGSSSHQPDEAASSIVAPDPSVKVSVAGNSALEPRPTDEAFAAREIQIARDAVKERLKDGDSAQFRGDHIGHIKGHDVACGEVNSRNSFGGKAGFQRYVSNGGEATVLEEQMDASEFETVWSTAGC